MEIKLGKSYFLRIAHIFSEFFPGRLRRRTQKKISENLRDTSKPEQVLLEIDYPFERAKLVPDFRDERRSGQSNLQKTFSIFFSKRNRYFLPTPKLNPICTSACVLLANDPVKIELLPKKKPPICKPSPPVNPAT